MTGPRIRPPRISYCTRCCYPAVAATPLTFDADGVCSGCRTHDEQKRIDWKRREEMFARLCDEYRGKCGAGPDCLVPASGGKDSFYQLHLLKTYGMTPLVVTYNENNGTELGRRNIQRMKEAFNCDHIDFTPSIRVLRTMNRIGLERMGDPDMHAHIGINSVPLQVAVRWNIPLVVWGEHGFMNLGGMHSYQDMVEYTARYRLEHLLRGFDWHDFLGDGLEERDLSWARYPDDADIERTEIRGIFISNYFGWNQEEHTALMIRLYDFRISPLPFDRTYKRDSNLNNIHDNGVHDYMKYIKFGYGRATDHACRDIRNGLMTRDEGIRLIRDHDGNVPGDLPRWLDYAGMTRSRFDEIADGFRDPRVWRRNEYGHWIKDNIWDHN